MNDLKNVKQVLRRPMTLLVTLYCLTIGVTYDRADFTFESLRNHVQKYSVFSTKGVRTYVNYPYAPCMSTPLSETGDTIGFRQQLSTTSFEAFELEITVNYPVHT